MRDAEASLPRRRHTRAKRAPAVSPASCKQLIVTSRLAAMRERVAGKAHASLAWPPSASIVEALAVTVSAPKAPRKKRTRCQFVTAAVAANISGGASPALSSSHDSGSRLQAYGHAGGYSGGCEEWTAEADLLELERCGLRVACPYRRREPSAAQPAPAKPLVTACSVSACKPARKLDLEPVPDNPQIAAALNDLAELQDCSLSVKWPK